MFLLFLSVILFAWDVEAKERDIIFPVMGPTRFSDDFGDPRSGGRTHEGNDIFGKKLQALVAVIDGYVTYVVDTVKPFWAPMVGLRDEDGYQYRYIHINNDRPGTDDGHGSGRHAYAPGITEGALVRRGQLLGWLGDSGNAETTSPHLHFEIRDLDGDPLNPYSSLLRSTVVQNPVPAPAIKGEFLPYGELMVGSTIAVGRLDVDEESFEVVTGSGPGGGPQIRMFKIDGRVLGQFFAYEKNFRGGVDVATGDFDADGIDEVITAPGPGRLPEIRVFNRKGEKLAEFLAYPESFRGGVTVAAADIDGDGTTEIITGAGPTGGPQVRVFHSDSELQTQFFAYPKDFRGGIDVAPFLQLFSLPG